MDVADQRCWKPVYLGFIGDVDGMVVGVMRVGRDSDDENEKILIDATKDRANLIA
jgi:hypothetical protein